MKFTIVTQLSNGVAQAIVATVTAAIFIARGAGRNIQFVVGDEYGFRSDFVEISECGDSLSAAIHKGAWNKQTQVVTVVMNSGGVAKEASFAIQRAALLPGQL